MGLMRSSISCSRHYAEALNQASVTLLAGEFVVRAVLFLVVQIRRLSAIPGLVDRRGDLGGAVLQAVEQGVLAVHVFDQHAWLALTGADAAGHLCAIFALAQVGRLSERLQLLTHGQGAGRRPRLHRLVVLDVLAVRLNLEARHDTPRARLIQRARTLLVCGIQNGVQQGVIVLISSSATAAGGEFERLFVGGGFVLLVAVGAVGLEVGIGVVVVLSGEDGAPTAAVGKRQPGWGRTKVVMLMDECLGASEECL